MARGVVVPPIAWLSEGMAGLAAGQLQGHRREGFLSWLVGASLPALDALVEGFATNPVRGRCEYAFSLAEYLTARWGLDALRRLVDLLCDGLDRKAALEELTGQSVEQFTASWHRWLPGGIKDDTG